MSGKEAETTGGRFRAFSRSLALSAWPGLGRLWTQGDVKALAIAIGCCFFLNTMVWLTFLAGGRDSPALILGGWTLGAIIWLCFTGHAAMAGWRDRSTVPPGGYQALFIRAQAEYLRGHWFEAQALLETLLKATPSDVDAQLMLAGLFRHTRHVAAARDRLRVLERLEGAEKWRLEIDRERQLLDRLDQAEAVPDARIMPLPDSAAA